MTKDFCDFTGSEIKGNALKFEITCEGVKKRYTVSEAGWKQLTSKFQGQGHVVTARNPYGRKGAPKA